MNLPKNLYQKIYQRAESLKPTQLLLAIAVISVLGVCIGILLGQQLRSPKNPTDNSQLNKNPEDVVVESRAKNETITGKLFPVERQNSSNSYSHQLINDSGKTVAYLLAKDDKLKLIIPGTIVTASGNTIEYENYIPIITVAELKF